MKVNRKKFLESVEYISKINECNLDKIDLSEFLDMATAGYKKKIEDWEFIGLNVKDFIFDNKDIWKEEAEEKDTKTIDIKKDDKVYIIKIGISEKNPNKFVIQRACKGFSSYELIGLLEETKKNLLEVIKNNHHGVERIDKLFVTGDIIMENKK